MDAVRPAVDATVSGPTAAAEVSVRGSVLGQVVTGCRVAAEEVKQYAGRDALLVKALQKECQIRHFR